MVLSAANNYERINNKIVSKCSQKCVWLGHCAETLEHCGTEWPEHDWVSYFGSFQVISGRLSPTRQLLMLSGIQPYQDRRVEMKSEWRWPEEWWTRRGVRWTFVLCPRDRVLGVYMNDWPLALALPSQLLVCRIQVHHLISLVSPNEAWGREASQPCRLITPLAMTNSGFDKYSRRLDPQWKHRKCGLRVSVPSAPRVS